MILNSDRIVGNPWLLLVFDSYSTLVYDAFMCDPEDRILTLKELSAYLKIPESTLYKVVREGVIPAQKIGKHWRFSKQAIDAWISNRIPK